MTFFLVCQTVIHKIQSMVVTARNNKPQQNLKSNTETGYNLIYSTTHCVSNISYLQKKCCTSAVTAISINNETNSSRFNSRLDDDRPFRLLFAFDSAYAQTPILTIRYY